MTRLATATALTERNLHPLRFRDRARDLRSAYIAQLARRLFRASAAEGSYRRYAGFAHEHDGRSVSA